MASCLGIALDIIGPCGFLLDDRRLRRAGLDYLDRVVMRIHESWSTYCHWREQAVPGFRLVLLTTSGDIAYTAFAFRADDAIMVGRESGGVSQPNVAVAAAMALGEALRQTEGFSP